MILHGVLQRRRGRLLQVRQFDIKGEQLEETAVAADWRTGPAVAGTFPVI